jgi:hypothetical protein
LHILFSFRGGSEGIATMADDRAEPLRPDSPVQVVMVNVTAPATLPAGYEFEAQVNGDPEQTVHAVVVCASIDCVTLDTVFGRIFDSPLALSLLLSS